MRRNSVCISILKIVAPQCLHDLWLNWGDFSWVGFFLDFFYDLVLSVIHTVNKLLISKYFYQSTVNCIFYTAEQTKNN